MDDDRSHGDKIKALIVATGLKLWRDDPALVSARRIGQMIDMTHSAVLYHFGNVDGLKNAIAAEAIRIGDMVIVPQLIASRHPSAASLSAADRQRFLADC